MLLEAMTALQNLAMPFTLDVEPPSDEVRARAMALASEVGIGQTTSAMAVSQLDSVGHVRVRLGRALALGPAILLLEHVSAGIPRGSVRSLGAEIRSIARHRQCASIAVTADEEFARAVAERVLRLDAASGTLAPSKRRSWW